MSVLLPRSLGGTIAASDSDSISNEISADGLPVGTMVWNADVGAFFKLTASTASLVTDEILQVLGSVGTRWIIVTNGTGSVESVTASTSNAVDNSDAANPIIKNASSSNAGTMSAADKTKIDALIRPVRGADLTDADLTRSPGVTVGEYVLPAATLTTNRGVTIGAAGSPKTSQKVRIIRKDRTANTYGVTNGGGGGGLLFTFEASPTTDQVAEFFFDSTNWILVGTYPVTSA